MADIVPQYVELAQNGIAVSRRITPVGRIQTAARVHANTPGLHIPLGQKSLTYRPCQDWGAMPELTMCYTNHLVVLHNRLYGVQRLLEQPVIPQAGTRNNLNAVSQAQDGSEKNLVRFPAGNDYHIVISNEMLHGHRPAWLCVRNGEICPGLNLFAEGHYCLGSATEPSLPPNNLALSIILGTQPSSDLSTRGLLRWTNAPVHVIARTTSFRTWRCAFTDTLKEILDLIPP